MKTNLLLLILGLAGLLAFHAAAGQEQLAGSIRDARVETARTADQLKSTLATLTALTKQTQGDLRPAYDAFAHEVANTEAAAAWTGTRVKWMATDGRQYFADWQRNLDGIANASLRKQAQKRLDAARLSYDKVEKSLIQADAKFKPFLSDLADIRKALANDITPGGVRAVRGTVRSANFNHQFVNQSVAAALREMDRMAKALSSEAK